MSRPDPVKKVSVHGGHSGQFCNHARDSLEDVIQAYIGAGFSWVGITEHMPPPADEWRYPDEAGSALTAAALQQRFRDYFRHCRRLQQKYREQIDIMTAFETETYPGSEAFVRELITAVKPDYLVGSVHHVAGTGIDINPELYARAVAAVGGIDALYCAYFDAQYDMLRALKPAVVGHFDLIRIFDDDYLRRLQVPAIVERVERNLALIQAERLIVDFNLRGFDKSAEQYPCLPVLKKALAMGIAVVPGDDSHGVSSVGRNYQRGVEILQALGANLDWRKPALLQAV
ncbi:MAG: histidinol-phosphatase [Pseudomonadales bacterium]|nr:histidinol-phosphatase [Pseudomonadales bacterium]